MCLRFFVTDVRYQSIITFSRNFAKKIKTEFHGTKIQTEKLPPERVVERGPYEIYLTTISFEPRFMWEFFLLNLKICSLYHEKLFICTKV